jgi:small subunit ribosomal protein S24e
MKIDIVSQEAMPHLDREEVTATIAYDGPTPSRATIRDELSSAIKAKASNVLVRQVKPSYGDASARIAAVVYDDDADVENIEQRYVIERNAVNEQDGEDAAQDAGDDDADDETNA